MEHALYFGDRRGRRGRKRKAEKMAEIAMAEALSKRNTARAVATVELGINLTAISKGSVLNVLNKSNWS